MEREQNGAGTEWSGNGMERERNGAGMEWSGNRMERERNGAGTEWSGHTQARIMQVLHVVQVPVIKSENQFFF